MTKIYDQHAAAFSKVSAFVILNSTGDKVGTVAIKFPRDGAGRLWAYVHILGLEMVRGHADGYGYDKRSAAVMGAISKICEPTGREPRDIEVNGYLEAFRDARPSMDAGDWTRALEKQGFRVLEAV